MIRRALSLAGRPRNVMLIVMVVVVAVVGVYVKAGGGTLPNLPTADVVKGQFVDTPEIRGEIRPLKSIVLTSPMNAGELQIIKLAKNGTTVKPGDVVVEFDGTTLQRTILETRSNLKQAEAEIEQVAANWRLTDEQNATSLMKAKYDLQRAKLDLDKGRPFRASTTKAKLVVADAAEAWARGEDPSKMAAEARRSARSASERRRRLERAEVGLKNSSSSRRSPDGQSCRIHARDMFTGRSSEKGTARGRRVDPRAAGPFAGSPRRLDESDAAPLPGQDAVIRIEAVPGKDFKARIERISLLARVDFSSGWPPQRNFDLGLVLLDLDPKIRPGMTAVARIATDRVPDVTLVPSESVFQRNGFPVVYKLAGSGFDEMRVQVARRGKEQSIVTSGIAAGDRIARASAG